MVEGVRDHVLQARQLQFPQLRGWEKIRRAHGIEGRRFVDGMFVHGDLAALSINRG
jgi:hypothetical protein